MKTLIILIATLLISTNTMADEFDYVVKPDTSSTSTVPVGSTKGELKVTELGEATYTLPISIPKGVNNFQPSLSINYNSNSGNGIIGWGCNVGGLSIITRGARDIYHDGTASGVKHQDNDAYFLDGKRLILVSGNEGAIGAVYSPEGEPTTQVEICQNGSERCFKVYTSDGIVYSYGYTLASQQKYTINGVTKTNAWYLSEALDMNGNFITYIYNDVNHYIYPVQVRYGHNKSQNSSMETNVFFHYEDRTDIMPFKLETVSGSMSRRLKSIDVFTGSKVYRTYEILYHSVADASYFKYSRMSFVQEKNENNESLTMTKFNWNCLTSINETVSSPTYQPIESSSTKYVHDERFFSADVTGDGLDDILELAGVDYTTYYSGGYTTNYVKECKVSKAYKTSNDSIAYGHLVTIPLGPDISFEGLYGYSCGQYSADFDGDGINDIVLPENVNGGIHVYMYFGSDFINGSIENSQRRDIAFSRGNLLRLLTGDFNNDGKSEIFIVFNDGNTCYVRILGYDNLPTSDFTFTMSSTPKDVIAGDFNSDGMLDIMFVCENEHRVYWNRGGIRSELFASTNYTSDTSMNYATNRWMGDFNGDGVIDFLFNHKNNEYLYFALGNNDGTFYVSVNAAYIEHEFGKTTDMTCLVYDMDLDGRSDAFISLKKSYNGEAEKTHSFWLNSIGSALVLKKKSSSLKTNEYSPMNYLLGNFSGKGYLELMNYGYDCYNSTDANVSPSLHLYTNSGYSEGTAKMYMIRDGFNNETYISYTSLANPNIYTKGSGAVYPMADCVLPLHVVNTTNSDNGSLSTIHKQYYYGGLKVHLQGKGILGMSTFKESNTTYNVAEEHQISRWNTSYFVPSQTYIKTILADCNSRQTTNYYFYGLANNNYGISSLNTYMVDYDGNSSMTRKTYNTENGYLLSEYTALDEDEENYIRKNYSDYVKRGKMWLPCTVRTIKQHSDASQTFVDETTYIYDSKARPTREITHADSSLPLTKTYTYNVFGNVTSVTTSGSGVPTLTEYSNYDASGRNVVKTYTSETPGPIKEFTYDTWGNVLTETDVSNPLNPLTTNYYYDGWGRRVRTKFPTGEVSTVRYGWGDGGSKKYYVLRQATYRPWEKIWYDSRGRETLRESICVKNILSKEYTYYNSYGNIRRKTHMEGNLTISNAYTLDSRGRILTITSNSGKITNYSYGNNTVTKTENGRTFTKSYDVWGNVTHSTDPESSVNYTYFSNGKPATASSEGIMITFEYDDVGNKILIDDPDAGEIRYEYDALGRVTCQTDARESTINTYYDALGRIASKETDEGETEYTYVTSGYGILKPSKIQFGSSYMSFAYDKYGRIINKRQMVDGLDLLNYNYSYNSRGKMNSVTYPDNVTEVIGYDCYGNKTSSTVNGTLSWYISSNTGRQQEHHFYNNILSKVKFDSNGYLQEKEMFINNTDTLFYVDYNYNPLTGNLNWRNQIFDQEQFTYDALDRLTSVTQSGVTTSYSYDAKGNITSISNVGSYSYQDSAPHAVNMVTMNFNSPILPTQDVIYNSYNKVRSISQLSYTMDFLYGPDCERWKTILKQNDNVLRTTLYGENYERITENGTTRHFYYLSNDLLVIKQNGTISFYVMEKDAQGSILQIHKKDGTRVFSAKYDAWGNQSVFINDIGFHRGYTGHEMLSEFQIINMNGRLYDPVFCRFFSPDNYVQMPDFSQSFNRYTYCLNNPLKYTDPSGEIFWLAPIITGALIGAAMSGVAYSVTSFTMGNWNGSDFLKSLGFGAFSGALAGGIGLAGGALGISATTTNSIGYQLVSQTSNSLITNSVFGHSISLSDIGGSVMGAMVGSVLPLYTAKPGSTFKNFIGEVLHNIARGIITGGMQGTTKSIIEGNPKYLFQGAIGGAIGGAGKTIAANIIFGTPYLPEGDYEEGGIYRSGGIASLLHMGEGLTMGQNMWIYNNDEKLKTMYHESCHYQQIGRYGGWLDFYPTIINEYLKYGFIHSYETDGTLENGARLYEILKTTNH